ncbi:MAG: metalloregulator ArsR/SmtB family transcription factor [Firmicutes bacterium]|nr:metalloregulator ArsR/SmtB family transcription factor [Bacillota bacterium]
MTEDQVSSICKALGDPNRLQIVKILSGCEKCACVILEAFDITQPTLSHHMKILCDCGLVNVRKDGKWSHYSLNCETLRDFQRFIGNLDCEIKDGCEDGKCECR